MSNLGGVGPDTDGPEVLRYANVADKPEPLDLEVRVSASYKNKAPEKNGFRGNFGSITMDCGTSTTFDFQFVKSATSEPVQIPSFLFTVFDIDHGPENKQQGTREIMTVASGSGLDAYYLTENTEVEYGCIQSGLRNEFKSTSTGYLKDNPSDAMNMTELQRARSVTFQFRDVSGFSIDFAIPDGDKTRSFLFASLSDFVCLESPPKGQPCAEDSTVETAAAVCASADTSLDEAKEVCEKVHDDPYLMESCMIDYCAYGNENQVVREIEEVLEEEVPG